MKRDELIRYLDELLEPARFKDYCPNGLQVEGRPKSGRVCAGVTASQALLDRRSPVAMTPCWCITAGSGSGEDGRVTGFRRQRAANPAGARHQPDRLPPAAGRARRIRQQRPVGASAWAGGSKGASASRTSAGTAARASRASARKPSQANAGADARACAAAGRRRRDARSIGWRGAPAAPRATSSRPSWPAPIYTCRARSPSRRCIWRANRACPTSPPATTRPSVTARRPR
jgi:hypothetical protein